MVCNSVQVAFPSCSTSTGQFFFRHSSSAFSAETVEVAAVEAAAAVCAVDDDEVFSSVFSFLLFSFSKRDHVLKSVHTLQGLPSFMGTCLPVTGSIAIDVFPSAAAADMCCGEGER